MIRLVTNSQTYNAMVSAMRLFMIVILGVLIACNSKSANSSQPVRLAVFLDSFDKANPKYYDFSSTEAQGDSMVKASFLASCLNSGLLSDFPLVFHDIGKSLKGQLFAHFTGEMNNRPGWFVNFDVIVPVSQEQSNILQLNSIYRVEKVKKIDPITEAWLYNVDLPSGVGPYGIRENGNTKIVHLGANFVEATIEKK